MMELPFFKPTSNEVQLKKRKRTTASVTSSSEDQDFDDSKSVIGIQSKRQIHSKIEKRRRDKMNSYISQLSNMIPTYNLSSQKLDKITVLRMAVQYLRSIQNSPMQLSSEENLKYSFISDEELKKLILQQMSEGFVFVIACDSAKILYISQSVSKTLNCNYTDLLGRCLYDITHPQDIDKIKEQISCTDMNHRQQIISSTSTKDLELKIPSEQLGLHPGSRRSFFCRIKTDIEEEKCALDVNNYSYQNFKNPNELAVGSTLEQTQYSVIQCIGYLKCLNSVNNNEIKISDDTKGLTSVTCLVAVGRKVDNLIQTDLSESPSTFVSKHSVDGKFLFVDHWITLITGYLPQEVLGTNIYDYIHPEDVNGFAEAHQSMLQYPNNAILSKGVRFRVKFGNYVTVQSEWKSLLNPWKKEVEYFYSKNTIHWPKDTKCDEEENVETALMPNDLFEFSNFQTGKSELIDFNFHSAISGKNNDEASMEAILKLLECDTSIAD